MGRIPIEVYSTPFYEILLIFMYSVDDLDGSNQHCNHNDNVSKPRRLGGFISRNFFFSI